MKRLSDQKFGLFFGIGCAVLGGAFHLIFGVDYTWFVVVATCVVVSALLFPIVLLPLNRGWIALSTRLGIANSYLILGIVFYGLFSPVGFLFRLFGKDPMKRGYDNAVLSYFQPVERLVSPKTYHDQF